MKALYDLYLITKPDGSTNFSCNLKDIAIHKLIKENNIRVKLYATNEVTKTLRGADEGDIQLIGYFNKWDCGYTSFGTSEGLMGVCLYQKNVKENPMPQDIDVSDVDVIAEGIENAIKFFENINSKIN